MYVAGTEHLLSVTGTQGVLQYNSRVLLIVLVKSVLLNQIIVLLVLGTSLRSGVWSWSRCLETILRFTDISSQSRLGW